MNRQVCQLLRENDGAALVFVLEFLVFMLYSLNAFELDCSCKSF